MAKSKITFPCEIAELGPCDVLSDRKLSLGVFGCKGCQATKRCVKSLGKKYMERSIERMEIHAAGGNQEALAENTAQIENLKGYGKIITALMNDSAPEISVKDAFQDLELIGPTLQETK